ncbi:MAG: hypothetical protein C4293_18670 [Nitrospiraceae bacterium]
MRPPAWQTKDAEIDNQILTLLRLHRRLTFLFLADIFPECQWRVLFCALKRLREQKQIDLFALQWDYEVLLRNAEGSSTGKMDAGDLEASA